MVEKIKNVNGWELNEGSLMANGLYNISNLEKNKLSDWFGEKTKNEFLRITDKEFEKKCIAICDNE